MSSYDEKKVVKENSNAVDIDITKLFKACLEKWWCFIIAMLSLGIIFYCNAKLTTVPLYSSSVKIYVSNIANSDDLQKVTTSDLSASSELVNLYSVILHTNNTLSKVKELADVDYSVGQLNGMLSAAAVEETQVFSVRVTCASPEDAQKIASTIGDVLPNDLKSIIKGVDAIVVEDATKPGGPINMTFTRKALIGAVLGFALVAGLIFIKVIFDNIIRSESDIEAITNAPILALIPDLAENSSHKKRYKSYGNYYKQTYNKGY